MLANRIKATCTTTGTGTVTPLTATSADYLPWTGLANGSYSYLLNNSVGNWELGVGVWNGTTLTRPGPGVDANFESSTGALLVLAGTTIVSCVALASNFGGAIEVSDGTNDFSGITKLLFSDATVSNPSSGEAEINVTGGGGGHAYEAFGALPASSTFTHGGASTGSTAVDSTKSILIESSANGQNTIETWLVAAPAAPFDVYARVKLDVFSSGANNTQFGLILQDSITGKIILNTITYQNNLVIQNWNNPSSFSSAPGNVNFYNSSSLGNIWLRMRDDGVNITTYYGYDGLTWIQSTTQTRASFMSNGADHYGFCLVPGSGSGANGVITSISTTTPT